MSLKRLLQTEFSTLLDNDSLHIIQNGLAKDTIKFVDESTETCFQSLARLPHHINRVDWNRIPNISLYAPQIAQNDCSTCRQNHLIQKKELMVSLGIYFGISSDRGLFFEDNFGDCVLRMTIDDVSKLSMEFFQTPGHKYLLAENNQWLLNITMEEDLYFSDRIFSLMV